MEVPIDVKLKDNILNDFADSILPLFEIDQIIETAKESLENLTKSLDDIKSERLKEIGKICLISLVYLTAIVGLVVFVAGIVFSALILFIIGECTALIFLFVALPVTDIFMPKICEKIKNLDIEIETYPMHELQERVTELEVFQEAVAEPDSLLINVPQELKGIMGVYIATNVKMP